MSRLLNNEKMKDKTMTDQQTNSLLERAELNDSTNKPYISAEDVQAFINPLIEAMKKSAFVSDYKATDTEAMGIILSKLFEWNGHKIMEVCGYALEDSNYHTEAAMMGEMLERSIADTKKALDFMQSLNQEKK